MRHEKNRVRIMKIFVFVLLIVLVIFIGVKISKENSERKEKIYIANIEKRNNGFRNIYYSHKTDFAYIQKSIFAEPVSKDTTLIISLENNQLVFLNENDSLEGQKLKDKLLQDEEFIRCEKEILNTDIRSISLSYTSYTEGENSFFLAFEIPDNEAFIHIIYNTNNNYHKKEKIDSNWYLVIYGKV